MAGQPPKYKPDELGKLFDEYLVKTKDVPNIVSFCLYIDLPRSCFYNYKNVEGYSDTIKRIEDKLESVALNLLINAKNPAGVIFYMKNKFNYADKQEVVATNTNVNTDINSLFEMKATPEEKDLMAQGKLTGEQIQEILKR